MPREKEGFRDNIELLNRRFPDKDMLNIKEVMEFTGQTRNTVRRNIKFTKFNMVSKSDLARQVTV